MQVTVELKDLETIVFATAVIKQIENALVARKNDPFAQPHLDYTAAHNNLVAAMNSAKRSQANTLIAWDGDLTDSEAAVLKDIYDLFDKKSEYTMVSPEIRIEDRRFDALASKGCVVLGQGVTGAVWAGEDRPAIKPMPYFLVKLTDRGRSKLRDYENKHHNPTTS